MHNQGFCYGTETQKIPCPFHITHEITPRTPFAHLSIPCHQPTTSLSGHFLGGYKPVAAVEVPPPAPANGVPGFSGFGHVTGQVAAAAPLAAEPVFSGFGHATGPMGGGSSLMGKSTVSAPVVAAAPTAPVFSGFGHVTGAVPVAAKTSTSYLASL